MDIVSHLDLIRASLLQPWTTLIDDIPSHRRHHQLELKGAKELVLSMRSNNE
jgi:hypothetical protein